MSDNKLADGFWFEKPRDGAPDFVRGRMSVNVNKAIPWLKAVANEKGYVNIDLLRSKAGKLYMTLNDWKPETQDTSKPPFGEGSNEGEINPDAIPL